MTKGPGRPPAKEVRERIRALLKQKIKPAQIARELGIYPGAVGYHMRALGIEAKKYRKALPVRRGRRQCAECREYKKLGQFPSKRHAACNLCSRSDS